MKDKIEILGLGLFDTMKEEMAEVERVHAAIGQDIGWHYYLDFAWILNAVKDLPRGSLILDAGAGWGLMQFILVEMGYNVISADFADRPVPGGIRNRYGDIIHRLNSDNRRFVNRYTEHLKGNVASRSPFRLVKDVVKEVVRTLDWRPESRERAVRIVEDKRLKPSGAGRGRLFLYKCDVKDMALLPDGFVDAVVSVSALEHNDHADFEKCVAEIERVTRPGGRLAITVSAAIGEDVFHEPSKGWCYSEPTLRRLFSLSASAESNFGIKDELMAKLRREGNELHKRLSPVYFKIGTSGMPWGVWDPKYQPVGVLKEVRGGKPGI